MTEVKFDDISLFLCDPRVQVRSSLRMALNDAGLKNGNIWEGGDLDAITDCVADPNGPDIVICDVTENTEEACVVFNAIRHNELGTNPFICIIAVAWSPKQSLVAKVVNSGADVLVAAPISPSLILDRIASLVHSRKPFVVTSDYVGPDRRFLDGRDSEVELIDVPNSLRDKALGQYDAARLKSEIAAARANINDHKIDRQAFQVSYLADKTLALYANNELSELGQKLGELKKVTNDLKMRAFSAGAKELEELCVPLRTVVESMIASRGDFIKRDTELLAQLSLAIRASVGSGGKGTSLARDIAKTVVGAGG
jgi:response regulator RpfG family c-di-GMP phosphodiesterase